MSGGPPAQIRSLVLHLGNIASGDNAKIRAAEQFIDKSQIQAGFGPTLLKLLMQTDHVSLQIRLNGAIALKNFLQKLYGREEGIISQSDAKIIKASIVDLMLNSADHNIQSQLCEGITIIAKHDFYQNWSELLPQLVSKLRSNNNENNNFSSQIGVLRIIESITVQYYNKEKNGPMVSEIRYILKLFGETWLNALEHWRLPLIQVLKQNTSRQSVDSSIKNREGFQKLKNEIKCVTYLIDIFANLIGVDWIEFFDVNCSKWMVYLRDLVCLCDSHCIFGNSRDIPSCLDMLLTSVAKTMRILVHNYDEEIQKYVGIFVELISQMVARLGPQSRYDPLIAESIHFLTVVAQQKWHSHLFASNNTKNNQRLHNIIKYILIRNVRLRDSDIEMYESAGDDWVLRDMEGSDMYTRRRVAIDLVRGLSVNHESAVAQIVMSEIRQLSSNYKSCPEKNFGDFDCAINLILALAVKTQTRANGATKLNDKIRVFDFFNSFVLPELKQQQQQKKKSHDIVRADCLKFVVMFRSQWDMSKFMALVPLACQFLKCSDYVLHTYAAIAIDRILSLRVNTITTTDSSSSSSSGGRPGIGPYKYPKDELINKQLKPVMVSLFHVLTTFDESYTNEYVMRAVLRVIQRAQADVVCVVQPLIENLKKIILEVSKNPSQPSFNHYMFETIAASIYYICSDDRSKCGNFEKALMPTFMDLLERDTCTEFHPYVYQIIGLLLRLRLSMSNEYAVLFKGLLHPSKWKDQGSILAISGLLTEYMHKVDVNTFVSMDLLKEMLGIFRYLIERRGTQDVYAFSILKSLFEHVSFDRLKPFMNKILTLIFTRLRAKKSTGLCCNFIVCLAMFVLKNGVQPLIIACNSVQKDILAMVVNGVWLTYARNVQNLNDRTVLTLGMIRMATDPAFLSNPALNNTFPKMIERTIEIFEVNPTKERLDRELMRQQRLDSLESQGFGARFAGLAYVKSEDSASYEAMTKEFGDARRLLVKRVGEALKGKQHLVQSLANVLNENHTKMYNHYCDMFKAPFKLPVRG